MQMPKLKQPLPDRIAALRAEIDKLIDEHVTALAAETPGVPREVLRRLFTNNAPGCQCQQAAALLATKEAA